MGVADVLGELVKATTITAGVSAVASTLVLVIALATARQQTFMPATYVYIVSLVAAVIASLIAGWLLASRPPVPFSGAAADLAAARTAGAYVLFAAGPLLSILTLALVAEPARESGVSLFDILTWLGTLATLAAVASGAGVAIYVKRRDDERHQRLSIMRMRQAWIDELRDAVADLLASGRAMNVRSSQGQTLPADAVARALRCRELIALRINPMEVHHQVLAEASRRWLNAAGLGDHLRGAIPVAPLPATTHELAGDWLLRLAQLILKIEWVVTSLGAAYVSEKVAAQWQDLRRFERTHQAEILMIYPDLPRVRDAHPDVASPG